MVIFLCAITISTTYWAPRWDLVVLVASRCTALPLTLGLMFHPRPKVRQPSACTVCGLYFYLIWIVCFDKVYVVVIFWTHFLIIFNITTFSLGSVCAIELKCLHEHFELLVRLFTPLVVGLNFAVDKCFYKTVGCKVKCVRWSVVSVVICGPVRSVYVFELVYPIAVNTISRFERGTCRSRGSVTSHITRCNTFDCDTTNWFWSARLVGRNTCALKIHPAFTPVPQVVWPMSPFILWNRSNPLHCHMSPVSFSP